MKHLDVFDFPTMTDTDSVHMRKSLINYFNKNRDNKDALEKFQKMLLVVTRKTNECLQEHEVEPRTASGRRLLREERDAMVQVVVQPVNVQAAPVVPAVTIPQVQPTIVGMSTTGNAQPTLTIPPIDIPQLENV